MAESRNDLKWEAVGNRSRGIKDSYHKISIIPNIIRIRFEWQETPDNKR